MTSSPSPPDLSGLSLGGGQRLHDNHDLDAGQGRNQLHYFATTAPGVGAAGVTGAGPYATLGASPLKNKPATRSGLPSQWVDTPGGDTRAISPHMSDLSSQSASPPPQIGFGMPPGINTPGGMSTPGLGLGPDEEIIPTAIVIKNIPFNVKRESLLDIIASLNIPTPYAFNYHLDQSGAFRGLAFANFRQPQDADAVVVALNGFDVQGRKLRVEYKKVLQAGEKERIEREKALRRMRSMQLEKEQQHAIAAQQTYDEYGQPVPTAPPAFTSSRSFSGMGTAPWGTPGVAAAYGTPPVPQMPQMPSLNSFNSMNSVASINSLAPATPGGGLAPMTPGRGAATELDLNDPATLEIYSRILLFKDDPMRDELAFSRQLTAKQRRVVHLVAQKLGVFHYSVGEGEDRYAVVTRIPPENQQPQQAAPRLSRAPSAYHLSQTASQQASSPAPSLRSKKSMPDMAALRASAPRLNTRPSNSNIREGFATIASPARRAPSGGLNGLFGPTSGTPPPVPMLPSTVTTPSTESPTIVRQPRGPGALGFMQRQNSKGPELVRRPSVQSLDTRSHEPFEI